MNKTEFIKEVERLEKEAESFDMPTASILNSLLAALHTNTTASLMGNTADWTARLMAIYEDLERRHEHKR